MLKIKYQCGTYFRSCKQYFVGAISGGGDQQVHRGNVILPAMTSQ